MKYPVKHSDWQVLRFILRNTDNLGVHGELIRKSQMTRVSAEGRQLEALLKMGLIRTNVPNKSLLNAFYKLTEAGKVAAEYGEFEAELKNGQVKAKEVEGYANAS